MTKTVTARQSYLDSLEWYTMPQNGGQIVAISHATDYDGLWEHCYDRSDQSSSYEFSPYDKRASERSMRFEPWNGILPMVRKPQKVRVEE